MPWTYKCNGEIIKRIEILGYKQFKITEEPRYKWTRKEDAENFLQWILLCQDAANITSGAVYEIIEIGDNKKEAENAQAADAISKPPATAEARD